MFDGTLDGLLEGNQQIVSVEEAASQVSLDLEGILPVRHRLGPALHVRELAGGEESHRLGINARNPNGTWFTLHDVTYLLEVEEIILFEKDNSEVVGVLRNVGVGIVYRTYTVPRLVSSLVFDALWNVIIVTFLFKGGWRIQIEYDDCNGFTFSCTKRWLG